MTTEGIKNLTKLLNFQNMVEIARTIIYNIKLQ